MNRYLGWIARTGRSYGLCGWSGTFTDLISATSYLIEKLLAEVCVQIRSLSQRLRFVSLSQMCSFIKILQCRVTHQWLKFLMTILKLQIQDDLLSILTVSLTTHPVQEMKVCQEWCIVRVSVKSEVVVLIVLCLTDGGKASHSKKLESNINGGNLY